MSDPIATRNSRLAITEESTQGTPVKPTAATQYIALQDGFSFDPAREELENAELTGSIGQAATVLGAENPAASISHYLRHSGVEGQEPNFGLLLKSLFGAKAVAGTQFDTVAASTAGTSGARASINVDVGEGASFQRGQALLIKDPVNGYAIRPVHDISADALKLGFNLAVAPGAGVNLGKAVLYKPATSGHPTLSGWLYRGNGGAVELIAGMRVLEGSVEVSAGQMINAAFSMEGIGYYFNPIIISSANNKIDFKESGGGSELTATIPSGTYKDPHELAAAIKTAMDDAGAETYTVTYGDSTGKFTIATGGVFLSILWNTGTNTANTIAVTIGFSAGANSTGTTTYTSANAYTLASTHTPSLDTEKPLVAVSNEIMLGDYSDYASFASESLKAAITNEKVDQKDFTAPSGKSGSVIVKRGGSVDIVATLQPYESKRFSRFRQGLTTSLLWNFGRKVGGNWSPGQCGCLYVPEGTITAFRISDSDGLCTLEMSLRPFVQDGLGEIYLNFV
jgi:hypothetical protein